MTSSSYTFVIVSETWVNGMIVGGSMHRGPCGLLAVKDVHCPSWLKTRFDTAEHLTYPT